MGQYEEWLPKIEAWVERHKEEYNRDLMRLVSIRSVAEPGADGYTFGPGCAKVLDQALELAASFGLETENDDYYTGSALLPGSTDREIAYVGHLDVVPEGSGWDYAPYQPVYVNSPLGGEIVGRGANDNKGPSTAALYALRCLKELGVPLKHTARVLWGCQEESGMQDMPHFVQTHQARLPQLFLVVDCPFPIHYAEKGILTADLYVPAFGEHIVDFYGGLVSNAVPDFAHLTLKGIPLEEAQAALTGAPVSVEADGALVRISAKGIAGHTAFPEIRTENAIHKLAKAVSESGLVPGEEGQAIAFVAKASEGYYGENLGLAGCEDAISGKTTCVGSVIRYQFSHLVLSLNIRYHVTANVKRLIANIQEVCMAPHVRVTNIEVNPAMYVPLDSMNGLPRKLAALSEKLLGLGPMEPVVMAGGTHARKLPNAIGYGPGLSPELEKNRIHIGRAHGVNESVDVQTMYRAILIYAATLIAIDDQL